jgi:polyvinyl alcohol dehydrogenase (cytochrome)
MTLRTVVMLGLAAACAQAQNGEALFNKNCAVCHNSGNSVGAPLQETLHRMPWRSVLEALETGKMKGIGDGLSAVDRDTIAKYIGGSEPEGLLTSVPAASRCASGSVPAANFPNWNGWADAANTRFQPARPAGLNRETAARLKLKWAFGFPGAATAFGTPAVVGGRVLVGSADGTVYALDARSGCTYWSYEAAAGVRAAPVVSQDGGTVYVGDLHGNVYALRTSTGALEWKVRAEEHPLAVITGSPKLDAGRLYVPVSGRDESIAATNAQYECCTFRGSVVALDAATGKRVWQAYTIADKPKVIGENAKGVKSWGPSGAVVWSTPTLDLQKHVLYVGTGVNYSQPATKTSDAIVAIDMESGRLLWSRQFTEGDSYNFACVGADKTNCPRDPFVDVDFGNSPILRVLKGGRRILVAGDKGGVVYAIDPDRQGDILWKKKIAAGGLNGGFMWGGASDEQGVAYFGISDFTAGQPGKGGGLVALQSATGEKLWMTPAPTPACANTPGCSAAQPAPVTVIPGVAFLGSWDGHMRAYDTKTGTIIWDFDTLQDFKTINGVKARGGSINSMGPAVAGGMVFTTAGYSGTALPGNVLLAFSVDGK